MNNASKSDSIIAKKAYAFALAIIKVYKHLITNKKEFVLAKQILRSGTSIGANINEALAGQSKRDFIHKLSIALKEARETSYWLNLLKDSDFITLPEFDKLNSACNEIIKILNSIIITTKEKYFAITKSTNS
jgi:four helix bundle protein